MFDFAPMRQSMVMGQILPEGVTNSQLLEAFLNVPREKFVSRQLSHIAYMDAHFPLNYGRFLLRPATLAKLLEALDPKPSDRILYISGSTGYGPALLGYMGIKVIALDSDESFTQEAERHIEELKLSSVKIVLGPLQEGWEKEGPYDKMLIEGCMERVSDALLSQLKENGFIIMIKENRGGNMTARKVIKEKESKTEVLLFDVFAQRLEEGSKRHVFNF